MSAPLIDAWYRSFGSAYVTPRTVITTALDYNPDLLAALSAIDDEFASHPHPHVLSRWLHRHENFPFISKDDTPYRFSRDRQGWRLIPTPALARQ